MAQYAWCTSPLRRYVDLLNQGQLIACARFGKTALLQAPFKPRDPLLFAIVESFEDTYKAYATHQSALERYWTLRYLAQEGLDTFDASVLSVRGAAVLNDPEPDIATSPTHDTSGVWVIVRIRVVAVDKPVEVTYAAVRDAEGRIYLATTRFEQPFVDGERTLQPGVPVTGEVAFEVPVAVVPQLSLRLAAPGITHDLRMTAMADVPLHISAGTARQWKADATPATLAPPAVVQ